MGRRFLDLIPSEEDRRAIRARLTAGISGNDLAKRLIAEKPDLKVILVSGYNPESDDEASESRSRFVFLWKPCPPQELLQAVRESLVKP